MGAMISTAAPADTQQTPVSPVVPEYNEAVLSIKDRLPPQNIDAERSVLSAMLLDAEAAGSAVDILSPQHFYSPAHQTIFHAIRSLYEKNIPTDLVTIAEKLKTDNTLEQVGGISYIASLIDLISSSSHIEHYARIVLNKYFLRQLIKEVSDIIFQAYSEPEEVEKFIDQAEMRIFSLTERQGLSGYSAMKDLIRDTVKKVESLYVDKKTITGVPSGFKEFDLVTAGLQPSDLVVLAARPSMGKTSLALNIIEHVAVKEGSPVGLFSLEMSKEQLVLRMLCSLARVDLSKVRTGFLGEKAFPQLVNAAGKLAAAPLFIDDTPGISLAQLRSRSRRLKAKENIQLMVVDYLQLMGSDKKQVESRQQEISDISRGLKSIARELNIPVIVLSQLNRSVENRQDHRPLLSDLRESGAIEQDADVVVLLLRKEYYNAEDEPGLADVIIAKQRNGPTRDIKLRFFEEYTRFENFTERPQEQEEI